MTDTKEPGATGPGTKEPGTKKPRARRTSATDNSVDSIPPFARLFPLGLQHVLALYAGAVAVPLIVGGALGYSAGDLAFLISADLFIAESRRSCSRSVSGASACGCHSCRASRSRPSAP